jgi:hypothetical protein
MGYFANIAPAGGPLKERDVPPVLAVLKSPASHVCIGRADCLGRDADGNALFVLTFRGVSIECLWLLIDRQFIPAQEIGRQLRG